MAKKYKTSNLVEGASISKTTEEARTYLVLCLDLMDKGILGSCECREVAQVARDRREEIRRYNPPSSRTRSTVPIRRMRKTV